MIRVANSKVPFALFLDVEVHVKLEREYEKIS